MNEGEEERVKNIRGDFLGEYGCIALGGVNAKAPYEWIAKQGEISYRRVNY